MPHNSIEQSGFVRELTHLCYLSPNAKLQSFPISGCSTPFSPVVLPQLYLTIILTSERVEIWKVWKVWFDKIPSSDSANTKDVQFTAVINQAVLPRKLFSFCHNQKFILVLGEKSQKWTVQMTESGRSYLKLNGKNLDFGKRWTNLTVNFSNFGPSTHFNQNVHFRPMTAILSQKTVHYRPYSSNLLW